MGHRYYRFVEVNKILRTFPTKLCVTSELLLFYIIIGDSNKKYKKRFLLFF